MHLSEIVTCKCCLLSILINKKRELHESCSTLPKATQRASGRQAAASHKLPPLPGPVLPVLLATTKPLASSADPGPPWASASHLGLGLEGGTRSLLMPKCSQHSGKPDKQVPGPGVSMLVGRQASCMLTQVIQILRDLR